MVLGVKDDSAAAAALLRASQRPATGALVGSHRDGCSGVDGAERLRLDRLVRSEHGEGVGEITGVHFLVGRLLVAHHPSGGRAGWRGNKEELVGLRGLQKFGTLLADERGVFTKVDAGGDLSTEKSVALEGLSHGDCGFFGVKGADDAAEGGER